MFVVVVCFYATASTEFYPYLHTLSLHDALPILSLLRVKFASGKAAASRLSISCCTGPLFLMGLNISSPSPNYKAPRRRSEEHTSELQSLMRISYAVSCLKQKTHTPSYIVKHKHRQDDLLYHI